MKVKILCLLRESTYRQYLIAHKHLCTIHIRCNGYESCSKGVILSNHDVSCSGPESCKSTKIVTSDDAILKCSGYESCKYGNHEVSGLIYCDSKESCEQTQIVKHFSGTNQQDLVHCNSHSSCHSANIVGKGNGVVCNGQESCWGAMIDIMLAKEVDAKESYTDVICNAVASCYTSTIQGMNVFCNGYRACYQSTITASYIVADNYNALSKSKVYGKAGVELKINLFGYRSAHEIVINSALSPIVNVNLYGYKAGSKGKLICLKDALCSVECQSNACSGFVLQCEHGSTCYISPSLCDMDENYGKTLNGTVCPTVIVNANEYVDHNDDNDDDDGIVDEFAHIYDTELENESSSHKNESDKDDGLCYNSNQCLGQTQNSDKEIRCFGPNSCKASSIRTSQNLRCDGDESCRGSKSLMSETDLICGGPSSCSESDLIEADYAINCFASNACANVALITSSNMIDKGFDGLKFGGVLSGSYSHIYQENDGKTVSYTYCRSEESCLNAHYTTDVNGKVGCSSHRSCAGATIKPNVAVDSAGSAVSCSGNEACVDAIIDGAGYGKKSGQLKTKMFCYGRDCAKNALIKEVAFIVVSGSMPGAFIDAGTLPSDITMTVKMRGYKSGANATIKARLQTKATLICQSYNACKDLKFDCFDNMGKNGKVCMIEPRKCMLEKNNGKYLSDEGIWCPIHIRPENSAPYEDWEQIMQMELMMKRVNGNDDDYDGVDYVLVILVPYALFLLFIWYKILLKMMSVKLQRSNDGYYNEECNSLLTH